MCKNDIKLQILILQYEREVSKSHTIFSSFWDFFFGTAIGLLGLVIGLKQAQLIDFDKLDFIIITIITFFIIGMVSSVAFYFWWETRVKRTEIENKIKKLDVEINPDMSQ